MRVAVVDMSTAPPRLERELAPAFAAKGVEMRCCPASKAILVAVPGAWNPSYVSLRYQWYANGTKISGADECEYS